MRGPEKCQRLTCCAPAAYRQITVRYSRRAQADVVTSEVLCETHERIYAAWAPNGLPGFLSCVRVELPRPRPEEHRGTTGASRGKGRARTGANAAQGAARAAREGYPHREKAT